MKRKRDESLRLCLNLRSYLRDRSDVSEKVIRSLDYDIVSSSILRDWLERNGYESKRYEEESKEWLLKDSLRRSSGIDASENKLYVLKETMECAEKDSCVCCMYKLIVSVPRHLRKEYVPNKRPEMCVRVVGSRKRREKLVFSEGAFGSQDNILIVGDGDLSFSCSISNATRRGAKITSTTYLTAEELLQVYGSSVIERRLKLLRSRHVIVRNGVDATRLGMSDCIFNNSSRADGQNSEMSKNQALLRQFFNTVHRVLCPGGEVRVTHKSKPPYCDWNIIEQAASSELEFQGCLAFDRVLYPGYTNRKARSGSGSFPVHDARIFVGKDIVMA
eukprot:g5450.t1